jgi:hypothetical protein
MTQSQFPQNGSLQSNNSGPDPALPKPVRIVPREFLPELQSAASMIMSREECAQLEIELQHLLTPRSAAA